MKILKTALFFALAAGPAHAAWCLHPSGALSDVGAGACDGQSVQVDDIDSMPLGSPLTYDPTTRRGVLWQAEVDRRAAEAAARSADQSACGNFAAGKAILDAIDADVAQAPGLTASQLTSATVQRKLWADMGKLSTLLRAAGRCLAWQAGHSPDEAVQGGASLLQQQSEPPREAGPAATAVAEAMGRRRP